MKKRLLLLLALVLVLGATGCKKEVPEEPTKKDVSMETVESFMARYIDAVMKEDYATIWSMMPSEVQDYAKANMSQAEIDAYVKKSVNGWYDEALAHKSERYDINFFDADERTLDTDLEKVRNTFTYPDNSMIKGELKAASFVKFELAFENGTFIKMDTLLVKFADGWYLLSPNGDDEILDGFSEFKK